MNLNESFITDDADDDVAAAASSTTWERGDGNDDDCDGIVDEGFNVGTRCDDEADADRDGRDAERVSAAASDGLSWAVGPYRNSEKQCFQQSYRNSRNVSAM